MLKLGPHHQLGGGADTARWLPAAPAVAKFVGDFGIAAQAPAGTLCVGRMVDDGWLDGQGFDVNRYAAQGADPAVLAAAYAQWLLPQIAANPRIDVWEGPNEQQPLGLPPMAWYARFCRAFARLLDARGKRAGLGAWSTGTPAFDLWPAYAPALAACRDHRAVLTRHEYGPLDEFNGLRYRADNRIFTRLGYPDLPLVISECGADAVAGQTPWRGTYWGSDVDRYWRDLLRPYGLELAKDPYVLGATVYTVDGSGSQFDVAGSGLVDRIIGSANMDVLIADWSMYQSRFIGDPNSLADKYNPDKWIVDVDWAELEKSEISAIGLRVGIGRRKDPCFDRYLAGVRASPRFRDWWFIYHAYDPGQDSRAQADAIRIWCPHQPPLGVFGDLELGEASNDPTDAYLRAVDGHFGRLAGIYSGGPYMDSHFSLLQQIAWRDRPAWWAGYPNFIIPAGWVGQALTHSLHQFTSNYMLRGVPRRCDLSRLHRALDLWDLRATPTSTETNMSLLLSLTDISDEAAVALEKHMQDLYADVQANARVLPYDPPAPPPAPVPALPEVIRVLRAVNVRTAAGVFNGVQYGPGKLLPRLTDPARIGGWDDRVVIDEAGSNIWTGAGSTAGPTYERVTVAPG